MTSALGHGRRGPSYAVKQPRAVACQLVGQCGVSTVTTSGEDRHRSGMGGGGGNALQSPMVTRAIVHTKDIFWGRPAVVEGRWVASPEVPHEGVESLGQQNVGMHMNMTTSMLPGWHGDTWDTERKRSCR